MKKRKQKHPHPHALEPSKLAISATAITSLSALLATTLALALDFKSITPILHILYGPLGYAVTPTGAILGSIFIGIDTFILVYLFAYIYNKLL